VLPLFRLRAALVVLVGLGCAMAPAFVSSGCGPEPIGVDSCRKIESARCEAAASCGFSPEDVADCKLIYGDQCLHGIENKAHRPTETETEACVAEVTATGACAAAGVAKMSACAGVSLIDGAPDDAPCTIVLSLAHTLDSCSFASPGADAGTTADADAGTTADADAASD